MFTLPDLPYSPDALEPYIDGRTMLIHHDKHHATYVAKLNEALESHEDLAQMALKDLLTGIDDLPQNIQGAVRNHGGGHHNHSLFWLSLSPTPGVMSTELAGQVEAAFGSQKAMEEKLIASGLALFGSGWVWLVQNKGELEIVNLPNQDSPLMFGMNPLLGIDVWEHAYYLKYQNLRPDYLAQIMHIINYATVSSRLL